MRGTRPVGSLLAAALLVVAATARAQSPAASSAPAIEPGAIAALKRMGAYLRSLESFQVDAVTTDEKVLDDGQKILTDGTVRVLARMPNRLYAEVSNDRHDRTYVYDGKTFTLVARRVDLYAQIEAPPTIAQLSDKLEADYGFSVPLVDLFRWGGPHWSPDDIKGAIDVGPGVVLGTTCRHYAFRQADVDWQVWLQAGDFPLPRRIVITTRTDEARPQHSATYTWNLAPSFSEDIFAFRAPLGTGRVVLGAVN
jgi:hypothetical protein